VIAVKTDNLDATGLPLLCGRRDYRHVRLLAADPVHVAQYGTFVTTPAPTLTSASVHVATTVTNSGASSQSVSVQGIISDPAGAALAPVVTPAQALLPEPRSRSASTCRCKIQALGSDDAEHVSLSTNVQVGGTTVDDDVTPFGIREIKFDGGMTLNGKGLKFQGVANHQGFFTGSVWLRRNGPCSAV